LRVSFVAVGDESFPLEEARGLIAGARTATDDLERDEVRTTVICDRSSYLESLSKSRAPLCGTPSTD
jgi:hypothetical protein